MTPPPTQTTIDHVAGTDDAELDDHEVMLGLEDDAGNQYTIVVNRLLLHHAGKTDATVYLTTRGDGITEPPFQNAILEQ